jgi:hypothetical protein
MAKARPKAPAVDRAIAAFRKAHPSCPYDVKAFKVRSAKLIRVRGYEKPYGTQERHGMLAVWSYADNGSLKRVA